MSLINRLVPLKYALLAVAMALFVAMLIHELEVRSGEIRRYGTALAARVIKAGKPQTVGSFLFFSGYTYTKTTVEVTTRSGTQWDYSDVNLGGRAVIGQGLQAWFYDRDSNQAVFSNMFDTDAEQTYAVPWPSIGMQVLTAFWWALVGTLALFIPLSILSKSQRDTLAAPPMPGVYDWSHLEP